MARQRKKQSAAGIFFSFFLRAIVIILGLVILAMGAYLIKAVISQKSAETEADAETDAFEDDQSDELLTAQEVRDESLLYDDGSSDQTAVIDDGSASVPVLSADTSILVLNGAGISGLAGAWKDKIMALGYSNVQAGNYTGGQLENTKIVVSDESSGEALKTLLPDATVEVADLNTISTDASLEGVQVIIIVGLSDNIVE